MARGLSWWHRRTSRLRRRREREECRQLQAGIEEPHVRKEGQRALLETRTVCYWDSIRLR